MEEVSEQFMVEFYTEFDNLEANTLNKIYEMKVHKIHRTSN